MNPGLLQMLAAQAKLDELRRDPPKPATSRTERSAPDPAPVTLRFGFPDDAQALGRLAALDSATVPASPVLLAEVAGEPLAALSLSDGAVIADPFRHTAPLVDLLRARAGQLSDDRRTRTRLWRLLRPKLA